MNFDFFLSIECHPIFAPFIIREFFNAFETIPWLGCMQTVVGLERKKMRRNALSKFSFQKSKFTKVIGKGRGWNQQKRRKFYDIYCMLFKLNTNRNP